MGQTFDSELKTRLPSETVKQVKDEAKSRELSPPDIIREALREYFAKRSASAKRAARNRS